MLKEEKHNQAEINSKGHLVIPKHIRHQFHLVPCSKLKIEVTGGQIVLTPHTLVDAMEKIIVDSLKKAGLKPDTKSLEHYQSAMQNAFSNIAAEVAEVIEEDSKHEDPVQKKAKRQSK